MRIEELDAAALEQVLDDTWPIWGEGLSRKAYGQWNLAQTLTPWGREHLQRVGLVEGGVVVASAKRYLFDAVLDGQPVRVLGIGAVFTSEARRGRGLAARLIEQMMAEARDAGCGLALLFSEIGSAYYERLGFTVVPREIVTITVPRTRRGAPGTMVRALEPGDLKEVASISATYASAAGFALNRTPALIEFMITRRRLRAGLGPAGLRQVEAFVAEEGYRAAAYIIVSRGPEGTVLEECGDRDPRGSRIGALLEALMERDPSNPDRTLQAWLPPGLHPPQLPFSAPSPAREVMMMAPISKSPHLPISPSPNLQGSPSPHLYWSLDVF